jgi:hypothetical protein
MPRNMSFMLTTEQVRNQTKDVTRRLKWLFLKSGDILNAVVKGIGLKKGETVKRNVIRMSKVYRKKGFVKRYALNFYILLSFLLLFIGFNNV